MQELTEKIIRGIKTYDGTPDTRIRKVMSEYTGIKDWDYGREEIDNILRNVCADYIANCDNPANEIRRYFMKEFLIYNEYQRMIYFITQIQVREVNLNDNNYYYINGFNSKCWE